MRSASDPTHSGEMEAVPGVTGVPEAGTLPAPLVGGEAVTAAGSGHRRAPQVDEGFWDRFEDRGLLGMGGMGEVRRVYDRELQRLLALKIMRRGLAVQLRERFRQESVVTARILHPGIVPVIQRGVLPDGREYYLMPLMERWSTIESRMGELRAPPSGLEVRRWVGWVRGIANVVGYVHREHGVVHRDLTFRNVLIGDYDDIMVIDWGIALDLRGRAEEPLVAGGEPAASGETRPGESIGTPPFMPPEQAIVGLHPIGPPSDVYALGILLFMTLTWRELAQGAPLPPVPLPDGLDPILRRATAPHPDHRYADGRALGKALSDWLDGVHQQDRAVAEVARAVAMEPEVERLRVRATERARAAELALETVPRSAPVAEKRAGWALEDEAREARREALELEARRVALLRGALTYAPELEEAHALLAEHHRARHAEAERLNDEGAAYRHLRALVEHDRAHRHAAYVQGDGTLDLVTDPPGAAVLLDTYQLRERRLEPVPRGTLGVTPLRGARLPRGSHRLRLRAPGCEEVVYPVSVGRAEHADGVRPGSGEAMPVWLPPARSLGPDDVYVPAGWFWAGGDGAAPDGLPPHRRWVDGFVIRRYPVTVGEYFTFLNALVAAGEGDVALACVPGGAEGERWRRDVGGGFSVAPDELGGFASDDWPIERVSWLAAVRYAAWEAARTRLPWRLPHEAEWEKAARGTDGRLYPWGDFFEPTWTCMRESRRDEELLSCVSVRAVPLDQGPYGVTGMAGNVRQWCLNRYLPGVPDDRTPVDPLTDAGDPELRAVRGGSAASARVFCRVDGRFVARPDWVGGPVGLRLVRSVGARAG